jgi:hypothetical protein
VIIAGLVVTSVTLSNHSLDDSQRVSDLSVEIIELEKSNTIIRASIADAGSLTKLSNRVEELGFVEVPKVVSLGAVGPVALR